jgi:hypothetical protein
VTADARPTALPDAAILSLLSEPGNEIAKVGLARAPDYIVAWTDGQEDPRDATRGGVNFAALPRKSGRESPLSIEAEQGR